jgi:hypothetical protein
MKALSLWQPWASAIALGSKRIETRSWNTNYRGRLAIHAAKVRDTSYLCYAMTTWHWCGALNRQMSDDTRLWDELPFGAIVATAELVDCRPTLQVPTDLLDMPRRQLGCAIADYDWTERHMGDFSEGRYAWFLMDIRPLAKPIPWRGLQGLFTIPDEVLVAGAPAPEAFSLVAP